MILEEGGGNELSSQQIIRRKPSHLFQEFNASLKIKTEVNEHPVNAFSLVFLLLQHKHVVVEELLKLLVGEVDAELLKAIELRDREKTPTDYDAR